MTTTTATPKIEIRVQPASFRDCRQCLVCPWPPGGPLGLDPGKRRQKDGGLRILRAVI